MMFLKSKKAPEQIVEDEVTDERDDEMQGIRCPHCRWRPSASDRWSCISDADGPEPPFPSCGTAWNTFSTRGRCPGCNHQWRWTVCLRCKGWSLHEAWYAADRS